MESIAIIGGTGNVGTHVCKFLSEKNNVKSVHLLTRSVDGHEQLREQYGKDNHKPELVIVKGDAVSMSQEELIEFMNGCNSVFAALPQSLSGEEMVATGKKIGAAAKIAGVNVFVRLSSFGIDEASCKYVSSQGALGDAHVEIESHYTRELGLKTISIRPTSFFSNLAYNIPELRSARPATFSSPLGEHAKVNWISCADIGAVVAHALDPAISSKLASEAPLTVYDITGPQENTLSASGMAEMLSSLTELGGSVSLIHVDPPPLTTDFGALWQFLRAGGFDAKTSTVEELLGRPPQKIVQHIASLDLSLAV